MPARQFCLLLIVTAFCAALASGLAAYFLRPLHPLVPSASPNKPIQASDKAADKDEVGIGTADAPFEFAKSTPATRAMLRNADTISSTIVIRNGVRKREFIFPACGIGQLCACKKLEKPEIAQAKGTVDVPADVPLLLDVVGMSYPATLEEPKIFDKINPKEFCGLALEESVNEFAEEQSKPGKAEVDSLAHILGTASHWPNLSTLIVKYLPQNEATCDAINSMKSLRCLELSNIEIDRSMSKHRLSLGQLEQLCLDNIGDVYSTLHSLSGSPNLKLLALNYDTISVAALRELQSCKGLLHLQIKDRAIKDEILQAFLQVKSVRFAYFKDVKLSPNQIQMIANCPQLTTIVLSEAAYSREEIGRIQKIDRRIRFDE